MPTILDSADFRSRLNALPVATFHAGETVFGAGTKTGRLLILKKGAVSVIKDETEIAEVAEPGAIFGELSALLDQPHTADVRALETSEFHAADAAALFAHDPAALFYVATILAQRLNGANQALIELKHQIQAGQPSSVIGQTVVKMEQLLNASGANLIYAGYPYDPLS